MDLRNDQQPCLKLKAIKNKLSHLVLKSICKSVHIFLTIALKVANYLGKFWNKIGTQNLPIWSHCIGFQAFQINSYPLSPKRRAARLECTVSIDHLINQIVNDARSKKEQIIFSQKCERAMGARKICPNVWTESVRMKSVPDRQTTASAQTQCDQIWRNFATFAQR